MKILSEYNFKNNKSMRVKFLTAKEIKKHKLNSVDNYLLELEDENEKVGFGLRPDEIMQLIVLLSYALWKSVKSYEIGILKGFNGFKF